MSRGGSAATGRRARLLLAAALVLLAATAVVHRPAGGQDRGQGPWQQQGDGLEAGAPALVFPLAVDDPDSVTLLRDFGDPRPGGRRHEGTDLLAPRRTPVVAVAAGTVRWLSDGPGRDCCSLALVHDDGWRSRYIHLDNDTPGTDDGRGYGIAAGLERGSRVGAGEVIGWVGDSGNAEATVPHLHFELRGPDGRAVDPYPFLLRARLGGGVTVAGPAGAAPGAGIGESPTAPAPRRAVAVAAAAPFLPATERPWPPVAEALGPAAAGNGAGGDEARGWSCAGR